ncbi:DNA-binding response regulator [Halomonas litopenaei]|uniref:Response regulator transcription factor n=2 Tax=Halomonas TaxID=2745 RepID=A0AAU7KRC2_9GAMM|nr:MULTISPECIES: response regulator transcription factor [Halomonas]MBR9772458.1 response regulator transcription factor [Gammaproteobacteria bacterium]MBY6109944.1 response regulator transcription factor [Halomonas sp. DP1Y21-3]PTL89179.1 DNA-binding response regulator [Halomonas litopenaei]PTL89445.1 DNA-binding response regulator [Halomonas sp. SYSU XM8]RQW71725.1 DNA-binding response regulator [Halomonas sp. YLB-10]|tara:strand:- start:497 stop:1189 length:693 start_codon:yes stop_codon:yes gene_type:complete
MRIAILEDDPDQQALIAAALGDGTATLTPFTTAHDLFRAMQNTSFELLVLDWRLPEVDGFEVLETLRNAYQWPGAVLFITADDAEDNVVRALGAGADDFLHKPLRVPELRARIEALGRRLGHVDSVGTTLFECGPLQLDLTAGIIRLHGDIVELTDREYRLAALFLQNPGQLFTRAYLLERIWSVSGDLNTRTVDTHISGLRRKLKLDGQQNHRLKSVYQQGYRLELSQH